MDSKRLSETLFKTMAKYGWSDIHYSNPFLPGEIPLYDAQNRWTVGVRTGPKKDAICIKYCSTEEDVFRYTSPRGSTLNEAVHKAMRLYDMAVLGQHFSSCRQVTAATAATAAPVKPSPVSTDAVSLILPSLDNQT